MQLMAVFRTLNNPYVPFVLSSVLLLLTRGGEHGTLLPNGLCPHPEASFSADSLLSCLSSISDISIASAMFIGAMPRPR